MVSATWCASVSAKRARYVGCRLSCSRSGDVRRCTSPNTEGLVAEMMRDGHFFDVGIGRTDRVCMWNDPRGRRRTSSGCTLRK